MRRIFMVLLLVFAVTPLPAHADRASSLFAIGRHPVCGHRGYFLETVVVDPYNNFTKTSKTATLRFCKHAIFGIDQSHPDLASPQGQLVNRLIQELLSRKLLSTGTAEVVIGSSPACIDAPLQDQRTKCFAEFNSMSREQLLAVPYFRNSGLIDKFVGNLDLGDGDWLETITLGLDAIGMSPPETSQENVLEIFGVATGAGVQEPRLVDHPKIDNAPREEITLKSLDRFALDIEAKVILWDMGYQTIVFVEQGTVTARKGTTHKIVGIDFSWCAMSGKLFTTITTPGSLYSAGVRLQQPLGLNESIRFDGTMTSFVTLEPGATVDRAKAWLCAFVYDEPSPGMKQPSFVPAHSPDAKTKGCGGC